MLWLIWVLTAAAGLITGEIDVSVRHRDDRAGVAGASVSVQRMGDKTAFAEGTTRSDGTISFEGLPPGQYSVRVVHPEHDAVRWDHVEVLINRRTEREIWLTPREHFYWLERRQYAERDLPYRVLGRGDGAVRRPRVLHTPRALARWWARLGLAGAPPAVDFAQSAVLVYPAGASPSPHSIVQVSGTKQGASPVLLPLPDAVISVPQQTAWLVEVPLPGHRPAWARPRPPAHGSAGRSTPVHARRW